MAWMQQRIGMYVEAGPDYDAGLRDWASLAWPAMTDGKQAGAPIEAWKAVIRLLADYRQSRRWDGEGRGGSFEPIRDRTGRGGFAAGDHGPGHSGAHGHTDDN